MKKSLLMAAGVAALMFGLATPVSAEVTNDEYADLLNAVAATDTNGVYNAEQNEDAVPEGLTGSDWKSIRGEYERNRHAAVAVDGGFRARNPGQQWLTHFDGRGFTVEPNGAGWRWGLELQSYGFPGHQRSVSGQAKMTAQDDRVTYDWDARLREWFVNDRSGLEHGFTLDSRPPGAGDPQLGAGDRLEFRLAVRGGLRAQGDADGRGVSFVNQQGGAVVHYAGLKVWDADGRALPARIDADASGLRLVVDERRARYPLTIDPTAQQAYLKASNIRDGNEFGRSVAVSGDTVVVGAPLEESNATGVNGNQGNSNAIFSGAAYVFVKGVDGVWTQQAYLKASNTEVFDQFGSSVAVSGDTVVVGATEEDSNATGVNGNQFSDQFLDFNAGAAYVFVRDGGGVWSQQAYLKASNTSGHDRFGNSVAVSGDTVVVGAWLEDSNATGVNGNPGDQFALDSGAAYVFVRDGGGVWSQQAYLKASNTGVGDLFGFSVGVSGNTVVVGAFVEDSNATGVNGNQSDNSAPESGAAYVFVRDGVGVWSQQAYLKASNTGARDQFGGSVAVSGDTVVVGAFYEDSNTAGVNGNEADNSAHNSGAAYVFVRDGGGVWSQRAYLKASNTGESDQFGFSVGVSGDTVVVGARLENSNATGVNGNQADNSAAQSGAAYVFVRDEVDVWSQQAYLKASNTDRLDGFGVSVAVSGDTVVVGAPREDSNGDQGDNSDASSGAAYVFLIAPFCGNGVREGAEECDDGDLVAGDGCSSTCTVESGYTCDASEPSVCTDIDECALGTDDCDGNATCTNTPGNFTCSCNAGYAGDGVTCSDVDECSLGTHNCDANATCTNTPGSFNCTCSSGFSGDGVTCTDDDECVLGTDNCDVNATCTNTPGNFTCSCNAGYAGDGVTCGDVNECTLGANDCDVNATCMNTAGGFICECDAGYTGDGLTCSDVDECALGTHNCDANATCSNTPGSFTCACNPGFSGDGVTCIDSSIPTVSQWGMIAMTLLLLAGAKVQFGRRRAQERAG